MTNMPPSYTEETHQSSSSSDYTKKLDSNVSMQESQKIPIVAPSGTSPMPCICPYCRQAIITRVEKTNGLVVWLASAGICLLGCALGCCLIPFFIDGIKDTTHYCPNCQRVIGQNKKL